LGTGTTSVTLDGVLSIVILLALAVSLALAIVVVVAIPARRDGRDLLGPRGEDLLGAVRARAARAG